MTSVFDRFINREEELSAIHQLTQNFRPKLLLVITGEAGIGKTTLLQQIAREFVNRDDFSVAEIDFDEPANQNLAALYNLFVDSFLPEWKERFEAAKSELAEHLDTAPSQQLDRLRANVEDEFLKGVAELPKKKHHLLICDTLERIQNTSLFYTLLRMLTVLDDAIIVVAGKDIPVSSIAELQRAVAEDKGENFNSIVLEGFEEKASDTYFTEILEHQIDDETKQKLYILCSGKPILMGLASTWLFRQRSEGNGQSQSWRRLLDQPLEQIIEYQTEYQQEFLFEIVGPLRESGTLLNQAIHYMALMIHPLDIDKVMFLLNVDEATAEAILDDLDTFFFVRSSRTLHDEMRRLVLENVWAIIDRTSIRKKRYLRKLIELTQEQRREAETEWDRWFRQAEELHYQLQLDPQHGCELFVQWFDEADKGKEIDLHQLLVQTISGAQHGSQLPPTMLPEIKIRRARVYRRTGPAQGVERECQALLGDPDLSDQMRIEALSLSAFALRSRDPVEADRRYEAALAIARRLDDKLQIAELLNYAGMVKRRLPQYEQAEAYLKESIELAGELGKDGLSTKASAMNSLAYVYRQQMIPERVPEALNLALVGEAIRKSKQEKEEEGLAYSMQTLGAIYRDRNSIARAHKYFSQARPLFRKVFLPVQVAEIDLALANIHRKEHRGQEAEATILQAIAVFQDRNHYEGLAQAYNEYGCELRKRGREVSRNTGDWEAAWVHFESAETHYKTSRNYATPYREADTLADMTLLYHYWLSSLPDGHSEHEETRKDLRRKAHDTAYGAIEIARANNLLLPESRALESLGELYYFDKHKSDKHKYFKAFALFYLPACMIMAPYYGSDLYRYRIVFDRVKRRLLELEFGSEDIPLIAKYMARRWQEEGLEPIAPGFFEDYTWIADNWYTEST